MFPPYLDGPAIFMLNCTNVTLRDFAVDYSPKPFAQGIFISANGTSARYKHLAGSSPSAVDSPWIGNATQTVQVFDYGDGPRRPMLTQHGYSTLVTPPRPIQGSPGVFDLTMTGTYDSESIGEGRRVTLCPRRSPTVILSNCSGSKVIGFHLRASTGFGILEVAGEGGSVYDGLVLSPGDSRFTRTGSSIGIGIGIGNGYSGRAEQRDHGNDIQDEYGGVDAVVELPMMATNADGLHVVDVKVGPRVTNSVFERAGDDFINIHGSISLIWKPPAPVNPHNPAGLWTVQVAAKAPGTGSSSSITPGATEIADPLQYLEAGSELRIYQLNTFRKMPPLIAAGPPTERAADPVTQHMLA